MKKNQKNTIHVKFNSENSNIKSKKEDLEIGIGNGWNMLNQSEAPILEDVQEEDPNTDLEQIKQNRVYQIFNAPDDESSEDQEDGISEQKKRFIPKSAVLMRIFLPIAIALLIGSSLGFGALHILENQNKKQVPTKTTTSGVKENSEGKKVDVVAVNTSNTPYEKNLTVSMVQAGVFSTKEAAEKQKSTLSINVPSVILEMDQKFIIFIGIADKLDNAKTFALNYQKINIEAFWKDVSFSGQTKNSVSKKEKEKIELITNNFKQLRAALVSEKFSESVMEMHATEVELGNDKDVTATLFKANNNALKAFDSYKKTPTSLGLIKFEQKLLEILKAYSEL